MSKFSKQRMIERLTKEGRAYAITEEVIEMMDNLDGQEASANCWRRRLYDDPVLWVIGKNGFGEYVNELDCE